jgi:aryl-alcohol dehydrogenase-like predicted oxidoreductase
VLVHVCVSRELGIALVPYSPLGRGFFAGYKPEAGKQDFRSVCNLSLSNFRSRLINLLDVVWNLMYSQYLDHQEEAAEKQIRAQISIEV